MTIEIPGGHGRYTIDDHDQTYMLKAGVKHRIGGDNSAIVATDESMNDTITIQGTILQTKGGSQWAMQVGGNGMTLNVAKGGSILGQAGVQFTGVDATIDNAGLLQAADGFPANEFAIFSYATNTAITNTGRILADMTNSGTAISVSGGGTLDLVNDGSIKAATSGVRFEGSATIEIGAHGKVIGAEQGIIGGSADDGHTVSIVNNGEIQGKYAIQMGGHGSAATADTIVNHGTIKGKIGLAAGDDVFDNRGGHVNHDIKSGDGDDTLITDDAAVKLEEKSDHGFDTARSSVSYTLSENVERLILIGKADIEGTGTKEVDKLFGNSGDNLLFARDGADTLDGGKGDDRLRGGVGIDTFVFKTGYGHDTITDFDKHGEHDKIDLSGWAGISSFDDVKQHWAMDNGNLVITMGSDELILAETTKADVRDTDFIFAP